MREMCGRYNPNPNPNPSPKPSPSPSPSPSPNLIEGVRRAGVDEQGQDGEQQQPHLLGLR